MKKVTVVIPVYKDWESLSRCLESLKKFLETGNQVFIINDMGREWRLLETEILECIKDFNNFYYYRNDRNIGFVKTCNHAVFDLDKTDNDILLLNSDTEVTEGFLNEMQKAFETDNSIAAVCPRSNRAAFLSIPVYKNENVCITREQSYRIFQKIKPVLPQVEEIWTGVGFAFLIKRCIIDKFGLFDEIFGRGYNEENDFCMRVRRQGYKIAKSNHAFVYHDEGKSFLEEKEELELRNSSILLRRYPDYWKKVSEYEKMMHPVDYFSDLLVWNEKLYDKKRVLICILRELNEQEFEKCISQVRNCTGSYQTKIDFRILTTVRNYKKFRKKYQDFNIYTCNTLNGTFHLIYSFFTLNISERIYLNRKGVVLKERQKGDCPEKIYKYIDERELLTPANAAFLQKRWQRYNELEKEKHIKIKGLPNDYPGNLKVYLYAHHIRLFIFWRKIRKLLQRLKLMS